jgi:hypothetical protein
MSEKSSKKCSYVFKTGRRQGQTCGTQVAKGKYCAACVENFGLEGQGGTESQGTPRTTTLPLTPSIAALLKAQGWSEETGKREVSTE